MRYKFTKVFLSLFLCITLISGLALSSSAAWDGYKVEEGAETKKLVDFNSMSTIFDAKAIPTTEYTKDAKYSALYNDQANASRKEVRFKKGVTRDWSDCSTICFDIYSEKATGAPMQFAVYTDFVPTPGKTISYYMKSYRLNFEGWKHFEFSTSEFTGGNFPDWSKVNEVGFIANGWDCTPNPESVIYISAVYGKYGEQEADAFNMDVAKEDQKKVFSALGNATAVMRFADNMVKDGKIAPIAATDKITTWDSVSVAPVSFFENHAGATSVSDGNTVTLSIDDRSITLTHDSAEYTGSSQGTLDAAVIARDGVTYIPVASALTALGKNAANVGEFVIIGTDKQVKAVADGKATMQNLKTMLCAKKLTTDNVKKQDWKILKDKWRKFLTGDENKDLSDPELAARLKAIEDACDVARNSMNKDTKILALFGNKACTISDDMTKQYNKLYSMAQAYGTYGTKYYKDKALKDDILFAVEWLYENLYGQDEIDGKGWRSTAEHNWWDWYCGSAQPLCETLLIMEDELSAAQIKKYLSLHDHLRGTMRTGMVPDQAASRVYVCTATAALEEDLERMTNMVNDYNLLLVPVESGNGTQEDGLYKTHNYFAYTTQYGTSSLLDRLTKVQTILSGTVFEFATPYKYTSCEWMYETFGPIMYNGNMTNALNGRGRSDETSAMDTAIGAMIDFVGVFGFDDDIRLKQIIRRNITEHSKAPIENGLALDQFIKLKEILADTSVPDESYYNSKIYYTGDMVAHQRGDFGFALPMSSSRIAKYESINGDNLRGWYQGDGMLYTYVDTDPGSYSSSYWKHGNPYHLPGTTVDTQERIAASIKDSAELLTTQDFVGAAGFDNLYTTAAMQLEGYNKDNPNAVLVTTAAEGRANGGGDAPSHKSTLKAKKAYFMFDDETVALGSDINADDGFEVQTVIENRRLTKTETIKNATQGTSGPYKIVSVTASGSDGNVPENTIDESYDTRWSAEGDAYVVYELEKASPIGYVGIAQYNGIDGKQGVFELQVSNDGINWTDVWAGKASGTTTAMEPYDMKGTVAKYVKYNGHGRTNSAWNSVTEVKIFPPQPDGSMPVDAIDSNKIYGVEPITVDGTLLKKESEYKLSYTDPSWFHIDGIAGYYLPQGGKLEIDKHTNNSNNFFEAWLSHGVSPKKGTYSYVVLPKKTAAQVDAYSKNPDIEIVSNTEKLQAVKENKLGITGMVFWEAGTLADITVSMPCIVMAGNSGDYYEVTVADPTQLIDSGTLTIKGNWEVAEADERLKVKADGDNTVVTANFSGSKGRTLPLKLIKK